MEDYEDSDLIEFQATVVGLERKGDKDDDQVTFADEHGELFTIKDVGSGAEIMRLGQKVNFRVTAVD